MDWLTRIGSAYSVSSGCWLGGCFSSACVQVCPTRCTSSVAEMAFLSCPGADRKRTGCVSRRTVDPEPHLIYFPNQDPHSECGSRSRRKKLKEKNEEKCLEIVNNFVLKMEAETLLSVPINQCKLFVTYSVP